MERTSGKMIPYEYNYYLAMSLYSRLGIYQQKVRPLHVPSSFSVFTFSNIISRDVSTGINGLKIDRGFLVFRTLDDRLLEYLKLGLALNPVLKIADTSFTVKSVKEVEQNEMQGELEFRTLSPVLIRDFSDGRKYVVDPDRIEENLNLTTEWFLKNKLGVQEPRVKIEIFKSHRKTARISSNAGKNSITTCFNLAGKITGNPSDILLLYYRGLGSKTGLGLGCWEVS
ncbi:CRISPR-associated endoribonuclease Cas6 [Thermogymnomonas acidicola]|uniref:CRISPR-associated endoribonuclease Cas6 n=1 Tax=Thermogymnomonas acidicola TaxID=399579 RepID=A0AA37BRW1_9ARCH|nr:CRISPR-associated endoribonuclease Cas6 [Thermogymnomonas acidicola]GGM75374.1 CRISPR-associated endoribonuclease Cas6 [Thermogymnomonas acidicola]